MKNYIKSVVIVSALAASPAAWAQHTYSGYFLDNYKYRFEMNPAFGNDNALIGLGVGNINLGVHGDLHLTDLVYARDGKTILFTNPDIPVGEAMAKFNDSNKLGLTTKLNLMTVGFKGFGGYNVVNLSTNIGANFSLPKSFFAIAKEGLENKTYSIHDLYANVNSYATFAINHSHDIKALPGLRVGGTLKGYVGIADVDAHFNKADITLGQNAWSGTVNADFYASMLGAKFTTSPIESGPNAGGEYVSGLDFNGISGPDSFGVGVDLGAEYKWNDLSFSAAVLDLGYMKWGKTLHATTNGDRTVSTDKYIFDLKDSESFDAEMDKLQDDIASLYQLQEDKDFVGRTTHTPVTMNFGVDYALPFYRKLHVGVLNSTVFNGVNSWNQTRVSANFEPVRYFSANVNFVSDSYGTGMGWLINLNTGKGIDLFFGMDRTPIKLAKQFVPLDSNGRFNLGFNFIF